jgi:hypothetical protein
VLGRRSAGYPLKRRIAGGLLAAWAGWLSRASRPQAGIDSVMRARVYAKERAQQGPVAVYEGRCVAMSASEPRRAAAWRSDTAACSLCAFAR